HGDQLLQPPGRGADLGQAPDPRLVPDVLRIPHCLGQEVILGLEVVDDQGWAGTGPLGHIRDPRLRITALVNNFQRRPEHLLPALIGRLRAVSPLPHGNILADENALSTTLRIRRTPLVQGYQVSRLNIQSNRGAGATGWPRRPAPGGPPPPASPGTTKPPPNDADTPLSRPGQSRQIIWRCRPVNGIRSAMPTRPPDAPAAVPAARGPHRPTALSPPALRA